MFAKIFLKEWRENLVIFFIAILMMFALIVLSFSGQRELTYNFTGMFLMLFLPFSGLLIGSGGFYSEFKDNAWIYLFSRPIKKERIWIFKYISLLSILLVIILIFFLVKQFLPGIDEILKEFNFPGEILSFFSFSMYLVIPFLALTISFSISLLNDKPFIIFFVSIFIGAGLAYIFGIYLQFLWRTYFYYEEFKSFGIFIALSFILASILTFIKSDFSQAGRKIFTFSKFLVIFLALSFALGTVWIGKEDLFTGSKEFDVWRTKKYEGDLYTTSYPKGIIRYNSEKDRVERIGRAFEPSFSGFSISGEKIAFIDMIRKERWYRTLNISNADGTQEKVLIDPRKPDSPFHKLDFLGNCLLSSNGSRVAFVTKPYAVSSWLRRKSKEFVYKIWWMNTDGSGLKEQALNFPGSYYFDQLFAWPPSTNTVYLGVQERSKTFKKTAYKILKVDLESGNYETFLENIGSPHRTKFSPGQNYFANVFWENPEKGSIMLFNLQTSEKKIAFESDKKWFGWIEWSPNEDKIAFSNVNELWVYYLDENRARKIIQANYDIRGGFDWLSDGKRLVVVFPEYGENYLKVFGEGFKEEKSIKIPPRILDPHYIWGLENTVLIKGPRKGRLWRVDLETEKWKKVY
jgi:hypothetical protein